MIRTPASIDDFNNTAYNKHEIDMMIDDLQSQIDFEKIISYTYNDILGYWYPETLPKIPLEKNKNIDLVIITRRFIIDQLDYEYYRGIVNTHSVQGRPNDIKITGTMTKLNLGNINIDENKILVLDMELKQYEDSTGIHYSTDFIGKKLVEDTDVQPISTVYNEQSGGVVVTDNVFIFPFKLGTCTLGWTENNLEYEIKSEIRSINPRKIYSSGDTHRLRFGEDFYTVVNADTNKIYFGIRIENFNANIPSITKFEIKTNAITTYSEEERGYLNSAKILFNDPQYIFEIIPIDELDYSINPYKDRLNEVDTTGIYKTPAIGSTKNSGFINETAAFVYKIVDFGDWLLCTGAWLDKDGDFNALWLALEGNPDIKRNDTQFKLPRQMNLMIKYR